MSFTQRGGTKQNGKWGGGADFPDFSGTKRFEKQTGDNKDGLTPGLSGDTWQLIQSSMPREINHRGLTETTGEGGAMVSQDVNKPTAEHTTQCSVTVGCLSQKGIAVRFCFLSE